MSTSSLVHDVPHPPAAGERYLRVTALLVCTMWFEVLRDSATRAGAVPSGLALFAPAIGLATQLAATAIEAAVAAALWRLAGARVRWGALVPRLIVASGADTLALSIASGRASLPDGPAAWLAGPRALGPAGPTSGLAFAFASAGVLALARVLVSAHLQAGVARTSFLRALIVVTGMWLATRLLMWWTFDLMGGRSFQP